MSGFEQLLLGIAALVLLFLFWPGAKAAMEKSKAAENPDWMGAMLPIGMVILFVILLILFVKG